jgi:SAM-dependent methyltransferase
MFGLPGTFVFHECAECRSLYLADPPADLSAFYPQNYYSYSRDLRSRVTAAYEDFTGRSRAASYVRFLRGCGFTAGGSTCFVDVGSGAGDLLRAFRGIGYAHVIGIDPYLAPERFTDGVTVLRRSIEVVAEDNEPLQAGVVMFHHSLEHVADPEASLRAAVRLVGNGGIILVRIPIVSYAFERFGTAWIGLDAPRHLSLPTEAGFTLLAQRLGLKIAGSLYDSTAMQFVASEALERGRTLNEAFRSNPPKTIARKLLSIGKSIRAKQLNARRRGDQAMFALTRA